MKAKEPNKMIGVLLPMPLRLQVERLAEQHHTTISALVRSMIRKALTAREVKNVLGH